MIVNYTETMSDYTSLLPSYYTMCSTILELVLLLGNAVLATLLIHFPH